MNLDLQFTGIKPINTNNYQKITTTGKYAKKYKTAEAKNFEVSIDQQMIAYMPKVKEFNELFNEKEHALQCLYIFDIPVITKKGTIAKRKNDIDNMIKPFQDCVFSYLAPDDSFIINLQACKRHSESYKITCLLTIIDINEAYTV